MIGAFFHTVFYEPLYNGLVFLIDVVPLHDLGIALIILTFLVRTLLYPLTKKSMLSQYRLRAVAPEIDRIKEKHSSDRAEQAKKTMEIYKREGVNPFLSFLTLLIQLPILITLYLIFLNGGLPVIKLDLLYSFVSAPIVTNTHFLDIFNLTEKSLILAALAGITQFIQAQIALPPIPHPTTKSVNGSTFKHDFARSMNMQFRYIMPTLIAFISYTLPSAIALYWTAGNIFSIGQELLIKREAKAREEARV